MIEVVRELFQIFEVISAQTLLPGRANWKNLEIRIFPLDKWRKVCYNVDTKRKGDKKMIHIGFAPDGSVVQFKNSALYFLKVCDSCGSGGVVEIGTGWFIPTGKIWEELGCEPYVGVIANSLDVFYRRIYAEEFY